MEKNAKANTLVLSKEEREKYPHLKTKTELKKQRLMPSPRSKPRAMYHWGGLYPGSCYLYDERITVPYKPSKEELERRRAKQWERRQYKKHQKFTKDVLSRYPLLAESIMPVPGRKIFFDVETTGLNPFTDEILKVSAVDQNGNVLIDELVKPLWHREWPDVEHIHHITPKMVKNAKTIEKLWEQLENIFMSAEELIAYNFDFDFAFLREAGVIFPSSEKAVRTDVMIDFAPEYGVWDEAKCCYRWQKLTTAAAYYGYEFQAHDSLEDAKATLFVYNRLQEGSHQQENQ